jgi:hypothetical protein
MRTTLDLDDELVRAVKKAAADSGRTMTDVIEDSLRETLLRPSAKTPYRLKLPTFKGRLRPGVDITDRNALYDLMEDRD